MNAEEHLSILINGIILDNKSRLDKIHQTIENNNFSCFIKKDKLEGFIREGKIGSHVKVTSFKLSDDTLDITVQVGEYPETHIFITKSENSFWTGILERNEVLKEIKFSTVTQFGQQEGVLL